MTRDQKLHTLIELMVERLLRISVIASSENKNSLDELLFLERSVFSEITHELKAVDQLSESQLGLLHGLVRQIEETYSKIALQVSSLEKKLVRSSENLRKIRKYNSGGDIEGLLAKRV